MNKFFQRAVAIAAMAALFISAQPASAHERRTVGAYQTVVGWAEEPALTGFPNAAQIVISDSAGNPVVDLGPGDLQLEVTHEGEKTEPLQVIAAFSVGNFGEPGDYQVDLIPSEPGEYSFRFFGNIKGQRFDETFTSGEETFASPVNPESMMFPEAGASTAELANRIEALEENGGGAGSRLATAALALAAVALAVSLGSRRRRT